MAEIAPISWQWRHFDLHTSQQWHNILALRANVFIIEQNCPYLDPDHKDPKCWHLSGHQGGRLIATLRAAPPGVSYADSSLGRVVVHPELRGQQLGRAMMEIGIAFNQRLWQCPVRISAQAHLESFYESLGFETVSEPYMEDDIPHLEMLLHA